MWDYTEKVMDLFYNPQHQGTIEDCNEPGLKIVTGEVGSIACGDALRLHLKIDEQTDKILDARFQTFGCASAIASSSALTEIIIGMTVDQALNLTNREIAEYLGGLPEEKMHCSVMGQEALEAAIFSYKGIPLANHEEDESAMVCRCFGISETRIKKVIHENKLTDAEQVTNYIKAGGGCTSCLADIDDLIAAVWQNPDFEVPVTPEISPQPLLTNLQKITLIQQVIDTEIKPFLALDGGDVALYDVEGDKVKVILQGACGSCSSSLVTLKVAIEGKLRERVLPTLIVEAVNPY
ncbi:Nitrogen fixation protein NifU [Planktothrix tepida]|uniref:Nitrogen fixation protein NifU n=2 Tax=Planktothrix TaxID=54304 RepID=A0A1J1LPU9_9CYAN|nr:MULTISPECIES: Fe-S cluster assembly protein NifU [Planktothrix]CAD5951761.1 Nitrogen fixation protein NifU [Planktothrix pseudagardhii]CAD5958854.1 Nitrogen fixation protein NifU [Planktothrix tepida]CUR34600.1 Nitrogen fixation protein NifU [Planktothrix tepida PCC 9214]